MKVTNPFKPEIMLGKFIDYVINFRLSVVEPGYVLIQVYGSHDEFPDYEVIASPEELPRPWYHFPAEPLNFEGLNRQDRKVFKAAVVQADTLECCPR